MLFGMMTELGELVDTYKKHYAYGKELDMINVMEEMGDIMWYWANMCNITGINAEASLQVNIDKLKARYPEKFNEELAVNRDLEKEREILRNGYEPGKPL
jgi:NTP pyrophosphatase (non-canonical NTP hydrolase)